MNDEDKPHELPQELPREPEQEPAVDVHAFAIRRVQQVVSVLSPIQPEPPPTDKPEPTKKADISWHLSVWSGPERKNQKRQLGMADMGQPRQAMPRDGAKAKQ